MNRKIYISNKELCLAEYCPEVDDKPHYECWQDPATQDGYNCQIQDSLEEFCDKPICSRLLAVIIRNEDSEPIGIVSLSPDGSPPDLSIMLYKPYRGMGYGTTAFALAAKYCFEAYDFECIYAGCYETNIVSRKMLKTCGFVPHPEGDCHEKHYLTGEPVTQYDYVLYRKVHQLHLSGN